MSAAIRVSVKSASSSPAAAADPSLPLARSHSELEFLQLEKQAQQEAHQLQHLHHDDEYDDSFTTSNDEEDDEDDDEDDDEATDALGFPMHASMSATSVMSMPSDPLGQAHYWANVRVIRDKLSGVREPRLRQAFAHPLRRLNRLLLLHEQTTEAHRVLKVAEAGLLLETNFYLDKLQHVETVCQEVQERALRASGGGGGGGDGEGDAVAGRVDENEREFVEYVQEVLYDEDGSIESDELDSA